jgi:hypothetical protein
MDGLQQPKRANILITGVPGTGKTTTCEMLAEETGMRHVNVGALVKDLALHDGFDDANDAFTLNEDKVIAGPSSSSPSSPSIPDARLAKTHKRMHMRTHSCLCSCAIIWRIRWWREITSSTSTAAISSRNGGSI